MSVLAKRVLRLEGVPAPSLPPVAAVAASLPSAVTREWAECLLAEHGWAGLDLAVSVPHGPDRVLLAPTPFAWLQGDAERVWLNASQDYPNALIMSGTNGLLVKRFDDEAAHRRWMLGLERELAA